MKYLSVKEIAKIWGVSERSVRNYCAKERVPGAFISQNTWKIPEDAEKPQRVSRKETVSNKLLDVLKQQKNSKLPGGIYHKIQVDMTYNSNHIEGSRLTHV